MQLFASNPDHAIYALAFLGSIGGSLVLTPLVRAGARRWNLFDLPDERKLHEAAIPRIGGVAVFIAVLGTLSTLVLIYGAERLGLGSGQLPVVIGGATAIHLVGLWDDLRPMRARWKLLAQTVIAVVVFLAGVQVHLLSLPGTGSVELGYVPSLLFTVFWFVGITNAFNLIDGLDGLAAGAALFALTTMFVVASVLGHSGAALTTLILAGATLGFLVFNFHPASIFMGDSGSLFLGFMLAGIGLVSAQKSPTVVAVAIPLLSLGLPVIDTGLAIVRRFLRGQPIFSADRGHIHHRLLTLGHSPRQVALLLYGVCAVLALAAMLLVTDTGYIALLLVVIGLGVGVAVQRLRFHEFEELARIVRKGVRQRDVIGRGVRIREISARLSENEDLKAIFPALEQTFAQDEFQRAEIRLRRALIEGGPAAAAADRRSEDDVVLWAWQRNGSTKPEWWEIRVPFAAADGTNIGSLVLWGDESASETCLSHFHTITGSLRSQIELKLQALWATPDGTLAGGSIPPGAAVASGNGSLGGPKGSGNGQVSRVARGRQGEREIARAIIGDTALAASELDLHDDVAQTAERVADGNRSSRRSRHTAA